MDGSQKWPTMAGWWLAAVVDGDGRQLGAVALGGDKVTLVFYLETTFFFHGNVGVLWGRWKYFLEFFPWREYNIPKKINKSHTKYENLKFPCYISWQIFICPRANYLPKNDSRIPCMNEREKNEVKDCERGQKNSLFFLFLRLLMMHTWYFCTYFLASH